MYWSLMIAGIVLMGIGLWQQIPFHENQYHSGSSRVYHRVAMLGVLVAGAWLTILAVVHFIARAQTGHQ
jgi:hypothetical protein